MAETYIGVSNAQREVGDIIFGNSGVNRECSEAWAGIDGVNREVFSSGKKMKYNFNAGFAGAYVQTIEWVTFSTGEFGIKFKAAPVAGQSTTWSDVEVVFEKPVLAEQLSAYAKIRFDEVLGGTVTPRLRAVDVSGNVFTTDGGNGLLDVDISNKVSGKTLQSISIRCYPSNRAGTTTLQGNEAYFIINGTKYSFLGIPENTPENTYFRWKPQK